MTSVREDLGYLERPAAFKKRPPEARYEGVREENWPDWSGWCAEVLKPDGKRVWLYDARRDAAIAKARNLVAALNAGRTR